MATGTPQIQQLARQLFKLSLVDGLVSPELVHPISGSAWGRSLGSNSSRQPSVLARPDCMAVLAGW